MTLRRKEEEVLEYITSLNVLNCNVRVYSDGCIILYKCPKCGFYFATLDDVKRHLLVYHTR